MMDRCKYCDGPISGRKSDLERHIVRKDQVYSFTCTFCPLTEGGAPPRVSVFNICAAIRHVVQHGTYNSHTVREYLEGRGMLCVTPLPPGCPPPPVIPDSPESQPKGKPTTGGPADISCKLFASPAIPANKGRHSKAGRGLKRQVSASVASRRPQPPKAGTTGPRKKVHGQKKGHGRRRLRCFECGDLFFSYAELYEHMHTGVRGSICGPSPRTAYVYDDKYTKQDCSECGRKDIPTWCCMQAHKRAHSMAPPHICPECFEFFPVGTKAFKRHIGESCLFDQPKRDAPSLWSCKCGAVFLNEQEATRHARDTTSHHSLGVVCGQCFEFISSDDSMDLHKQSHPGCSEASYQRAGICSLCKCEFLGDLILDAKLHDCIREADTTVTEVPKLIKCESTAMFSCPPCMSSGVHAVFITRDDCVAHLQKNHGLKGMMPMCNICGKDFETATDMYEHFVLHTTTRSIRRGENYRGAMVLQFDGVGRYLLSSNVDELHRYLDNPAVLNLDAATAREQYAKGRMKRNHTSDSEKDPSSSLSAKKELGSPALLTAGSAAAAADDQTQPQEELNMGMSSFPNRKTVRPAASAHDQIPGRKFVIPAPGKSTEPLFHCPSCAARFFFFKDVRTHMINAHGASDDNSTEVYMWCQICASRKEYPRFASHLDVNMHMYEIHHFKEAIPDLSIFEERSGKSKKGKGRSRLRKNAPAIVGCQSGHSSSTGPSLCGNSGSGVDGADDRSAVLVLKDELKDAAAVRYYCHHCSFSSESTRALIEHNQTHPPREDMYNCPECGRGYITMNPRPLFIHMTLVHNLELKDYDEVLDQILYEKDRFADIFSAAAATAARPQQDVSAIAANLSVAGSANVDRNESIDGGLSAGVDIGESVAFADSPIFVKIPPDTVNKVADELSSLGDGRQCSVERETDAAEKESTDLVCRMCHLVCSNEQSMALHKRTHGLAYIASSRPKI